MLETQIENGSYDSLQKVLDDFDDALARGLIDAGHYLEGEIKAQIFDLFGSTTGALARSFRTTPTYEEDGTLKIGVFSNLEYARIQDEGGTIYPKTGKYLAVPVSDYVKKKVGFWPRDWASGTLDILPWKSKKGNWLLGEKGRNGKWTIHYALIKEANIKGRQYLEAAMDSAEAGIKAILGDEVDSLLKKA